MTGDEIRGELVKRGLTDRDIKSRAEEKLGRPVSRYTVNLVRRGIIGLGGEVGPVVQEEIAAALGLPVRKVFPHRK